jgi:hypothetical protein
LKVEPIGKARLIGMPIPFKEGNVNATYRGQILVAGNVIKNSILKDLTQKELCVELFVASLGKLLGLPVPNAFLVLSDKNIGTIIGPQISTGERLLFASEDANTPALSKWVNPNLSNYESLLKRLAKSKGIESLFSFDTWIANVDRNLGNLLFGSNGIWMIDHGQAFGGPTIALDALVPNKSYPQKLTMDLGKLMSEVEKECVAQKCNLFPTESALVDSKLLLSNSLIESIWGKTDFDRAIKFLEDRRSHVPKLGSALVGQNVLV